MAVEDPTARDFALFLRRLIDDRLMSQAEGIQETLQARNTDMGFSHGRVAAEIEVHKKAWPSHVWDASQPAALQGSRVVWRKELRQSDPLNRSEYILGMSPSEVGRCLRLEPIARLFQSHLVNADVGEPRGSMHGSPPGPNRSLWRYQGKVQESEWNLEFISLRPQNCVAEARLTWTEAPKLDSNGIAAAVGAELDEIAKLSRIVRPESPAEVVKLLALIPTKRPELSGAARRLDKDVQDYVADSPPFRGQQVQWALKDGRAPTAQISLTFDNVRNFRSYRYCIPKDAIEVHMRERHGMNLEQCSDMPSTFGSGVCLATPAKSREFQTHLRLFAEDGPDACFKLSKVWWRRQP